VRRERRWKRRAQLPPGKPAWLSVQEGKATLALNPRSAFGFTSAANPELLPQPKPRAMREHFVVPSIGSREVALAERSGVQHREDALHLAAQFAALLRSVNPDPQKGTSALNEVAYGHH
jgi:hypothetical protein